MGHDGDARSPESEAGDNSSLWAAANRKDTERVHVRRMETQVGPAIVSRQVLEQGNDRTEKRLTEGLYNALTGIDISFGDGNLHSAYECRRFGSMS